MMTNPTSATFVDPTDPGYDVETLRNHVRALERRVRQLHEERLASSPREAAQTETSADTRDKLPPNAPKAYLCRCCRCGERFTGRKLDRVCALCEAASAPPAAATCHHRIADARNKYVESGYVCVDCHAVFQAADHGKAPAAATVEVPDERKAFEAAMNAAWPLLADDPDCFARDGEKYISSLTIIGWSMWQARAALSTPAEGGELPVAFRVQPRYEDEQGYFDFTDCAEAAEKLRSKGWTVTPLYARPTPAAAAGVPPGMVLVPREPTPQMLRAMTNVWAMDADSPENIADARLAFAEMLLAASGAPAGVTPTAEGQQ